MTNEWEEFLAYTKKPEYTAASKRDNTYAGRMLIDTFADHTGLGRVLTVIARGYLYHSCSGELMAGSAYDRIQYARDALCAWCSCPEAKHKSEPQVDFRKLSEQFPELVDSKGQGWFCRHEKNVMRFIKNNKEIVSSAAAKKAEVIDKSFSREWKKKVKQLQVPIFAVNTKGSWTLRFDDIIADALEAGPLRTEEYRLNAEMQRLIQDITPDTVPLYVAEDVAAFYLANRTEDTDWVVLPVTNFCFYYGNSMFDKKYLKALTDKVIIRDRSCYGATRYKLTDELMQVIR